MTFLELFDMFARNSTAGRLTLRDLVGGHTEQDLRDDGYEEPTPGCGGFYKWVGLRGRGWSGCEFKRYFFSPDGTESSDGAAFFPQPKLIPALARLRKNGPFTMALWGMGDGVERGMLEFDGRFEVYFGTDRRGNNYVVEQVQSCLFPADRRPHLVGEHLTLTSPVMPKAIKHVALQRFVAFLHRSGLQLT
ncbi:MAG: hypothetical protein FWH11_11335 [Micrococcales bacterium]|nr:hypothetical protein [Micrococcales bacterium]